VNLKAGAQALGLDVGSTGWAILEKLVGLDGDDYHNVGEEWGEIWRAVYTGKVLPDLSNSKFL